VVPGVTAAAPSVAGTPQLPIARFSTGGWCEVTEQAVSARSSQAAGKALIPLALAPFICGFAGTNMTVMIKDISESLHTTLEGVNTAITLFLLVMAALMIPCGKLTDRYGRVRLFRIGLVLFGAGALVAAIAPGLGLLIVGYSILQGVGTALLIPPVCAVRSLRTLSGCC
jgi:predicted MFS family arabinose efflux permease